MKLEKLYLIIKDRKDNPKRDSYVSLLFKKGLDGISQKIGEEATEVVIASKNNHKRRLTQEMADLWFHSLILLVEKDVEIKDIFNELKRRREQKTKT